MGNFSRDTFDKLKHYVGVRLQQGVPIVDADWNELEDIRKYELQAFLKWYVGNGIPKGNDGFHILPAMGSDNDFVIKGGDGTPEGAGRCLVEGWDVINEKDLNYKDQRLFNDPLPALTTPTGDRTDTVYLDLWEREVGAAEDFEHLVNPIIGIETCVRRKREWVVRVAEGASAPPEETPEGHVFYVLAHLNRPQNAAAIADIVDRRLIELTVISQHDIDQIVKDAYGTAYTLDHDGRPNLKVSLRDAINALLRGGLPSTPEQSLTTGTTYREKPLAITDNQGTIWVFWTEGIENRDIWCKGYYPNKNQWGNNRQLTTDPTRDLNPFVLQSRQGEIWLFWRSGRTGEKGSRSIWYNLYNPTTGTWGSDSQLTTTGSQDYDFFPYALEDRQGNIWVFWQRTEQTQANIWRKKYDRGASTWKDEERLTDAPAPDLKPVAAEDGAGTIWVFWSSNRGTSSDIYYRRYLNQSWESQDSQLSPSGNRDKPFVLWDKDGSLWLFWHSLRDQSQNYDIMYNKTSLTNLNVWEQERPLTSDPSSDINPFAFQDSSGDVWVFWQSQRGGGNSDIWYRRYNKVGGWGQELALTTNPLNDKDVFALQDSVGDIGVFWLREQQQRDYIDIWFKRLIPAI